MTSTAVVLQSLALSMQSLRGPNLFGKIIMDAQPETGDVVFGSLNILEAFPSEHPLFNLMRSAAKDVQAVHGCGVSTFILWTCYLYNHCQRLVRGGLHPHTIGQLLAEIIPSLQKHSLKRMKLERNGLQEHQDEWEKLAVHLMPGHPVARATACSLACKFAKAHRSSQQQDPSQVTEWNLGRMSFFRCSGHKQPSISTGVLIHTSPATLIPFSFSTQQAAIKCRILVLVDSKLAHRASDDSAVLYGNTIMQALEQRSHRDDAFIASLLALLKKHDITAVMSSNRIEYTFAQSLANAGIMCMGFVRSHLLLRLSRVTGARLLTDVTNIAESDIGVAKLTVLCSQISSPFEDNSTPLGPSSGVHASGVLFEHIDESKLELIDHTAPLLVLFSVASEAQAARFEMLTRKCVALLRNACRHADNLVAGGGCVELMWLRILRDNDILKQRKEEEGKQYNDNNEYPQIILDARQAVEKTVTQVIMSLLQYNVGLSYTMALNKLMEAEKAPQVSSLIDTTIVNTIDAEPWCAYPVQLDLVDRARCLVTRLLLLNK